MTNSSGVRGSTIGDRNRSTIIGTGFGASSCNFGWVGQVEILGTGFAAAISRSVFLQLTMICSLRRFILYLMLFNMLGSSIRVGGEKFAGVQVPSRFALKITVGLQISVVGT